MMTKRTIESARSAIGNFLLPFHLLILCLPIDGMASNVIIVDATWRH